jgi:hypothetical protein
MLKPVDLQIVGRGVAHAGQHPGQLAEGPHQSDSPEEAGDGRPNEKPEYGKSRVFHNNASTVVTLQKSLNPNLSEDLAISFYIQSHKLIFAIYQLTNNHGTMKYDSTHAESSVPWLNEVLVFFTVGLQLCQQLKDKICVFSQYKDFTVGSRPSSPSQL